MKRRGFLRTMVGCIVAPVAMVLPTPTPKPKTVLIDWQVDFMPASPEQIRAVGRLISRSVAEQSRAMSGKGVVF